MAEEINKLCKLCTQDCKQNANVLIIACPNFRDPRKTSGKLLNLGKMRRKGTITTLAEGKEER